MSPGANKIRGSEGVRDYCKTDKVIPWKSNVSVLRRVVFFSSMFHVQSIIIWNQETHSIKSQIVLQGLSFSFFFASSKYTCADFGKPIYKL